MHLRKFLASVIGLAVAASTLCAQSVLLAGWDFQTTSNGGTAAAAAPGSPTTYLANFGTQDGTAALYVNGSNGSSVWNTATSPANTNQITAFGGSATNAGAGFSTTTSGAASLALLNQSANGLGVVFALSMTGYEDLAISYATQRTATGFTSQTWQYSTDGVNFNTFYTNSMIASSFGGGAGGVTASVLSSVDDAATVYIRAIFAGATSGSGNNRLDNIQFNATTLPASAVPEPSTYAAIFGGLALVGTVVYRRRQTKTVA